MALQTGRRKSTFTAVSSYLPVICGSVPVINHAVPSAERSVFNDAVTFAVESEYQTKDGCAGLIFVDQLS